jgi:5-oxopent-3-ene-1,2,5-tricarboxylate decarboxylase / 2-hydroxyhepta-2,4-diene-1,7-dioate isomerase
MTSRPPATASIPIHGTVYGVLLNAAAEWQSAASLMQGLPYKAAPQAPVLYIKTANTWSAHDSAVLLPADEPRVEIGATLGAVMGESGAVAGFVLLNDWSLPHSVQNQGFYRPPIKRKCLDGFLGVGALVVSADQLPQPNALVLHVRVNGELQQTVRLDTMRRRLPQLIDEVSEFMVLQAGDVLMLGLDVADGADAPTATATAECANAAHPNHWRPCAKVGDVIEISCPAESCLGVLRQRIEGEQA